MRMLLRVTSMKPYQVQEWVKGVGKEAEFRSIDKGWLICFSNNLSFVLEEEPKLRQGDLVTLTLEKAG